jgi:hypothetical protein
VRSNLSGSAAFRVTKRSRPPSKIPWATLMAQLEWMLYGGNLHDSGPMRENKLDSLYRSAPLRSPDRR